MLIPISTLQLVLMVMWRVFKEHTCEVVKFTELYEDLCV